MKTILVVGATQGTGLETVKLLLHKDFKVRAFVRNEEKLRANFTTTDVESVKGDLRSAEGMEKAVDGTDSILFTAGVTKRPCPEELIVSTEYEGMKRLIRSAKEMKFSGRILFMSSIGVTKSSWASKLLDKVKGRALYWRRRTEEEIRGSGFEYTIVRAGFLMNSNRGSKKVELSQKELPLWLRYRIGRKDTAELLVEAESAESASNKTFDAVWAKSDQKPFDEQFELLKRDV